MYGLPLSLVVLGGLGLVCSLFYGTFAVRIFVRPDTMQALPPYHWTWYVHQFIFNFVGSAVGWLCMIFFAMIAEESGMVHVRAGHYLLLVPAVIGIVGYLPQTLVAVVSGTTRALAAVVEKLVSKI